MATKKLTAIQNAINNAMAAIGAAHDAALSAQSLICKGADMQWEAWNTKPKNSEALNEFIGRTRDECIKIGLKDKYEGYRWNNHWQVFSAYLHCKLMPSAKAEYGAKNVAVTGADITPQSPKQAIEAVAREVRRLHGTGRNTSPRNSPKVEKHNAADVQRASMKDFVINHDSVKALIERVLKMQSGVGLLHDVLKAHGFSLVKLASKEDVTPKPQAKASAVPASKRNTRRSK